MSSILIVDDDQVTRHLLKKVLTGWNYWPNYAR